MEQELQGYEEVFPIHASQRKSSLSSMYTVVGVFLPSLMVTLIVMEGPRRFISTSACLALGTFVFMLTLGIAFPFRVLCRCVSLAFYKCYSALGTFVSMLLFVLVLVRSLVYAAHLL